jgi:hypothetical protein
MHSPMHLPSHCARGTLARDCIMLSASTSVDRDVDADSSPGESQSLPEAVEVMETQPKSIIENCHCDLTCKGKMSNSCAGADHEGACRATATRRQLDDPAETRDAVIRRLDATTPQSRNDAATPQRRL